MARKYLSGLISTGRDGVAFLLFVVWLCDMRLRVELHEWKHALHTGFAWGQIFTGWGL